MKLLREGTKATVKYAKSESAKAENAEIATSELEELTRLAKWGDAQCQCDLALYYAEKRDFDMATYWIEKSAAQGNERALEIIEMLQKG